MYTTDGHIIITLTAGHSVPCLHPPPPTQTAHHRPQDAPQSHGGTGADQTPTEGQTGDTGTARATGAAGAGTGSETEPESVGGGRWADRTGGAAVGQAEPPADRQSHAEPPRMPHRVQLPPQTQTGRRERQRAAHDTIYKAREGQPKPPN